MKSAELGVSKIGLYDSITGLHAPDIEVAILLSSKC